MADPAPLLTLIDASGFIFRAYHAIQSLSTSRGIPTNAVYGFTRMLLKTMRELQSTHLALCFDKQSRSGRQEIDPTYKANRPGPPDDLVPQFELIRRVVQVLQVPVLEYSGWEADDVIATLVRAAREQGFRVQIVTGDKDMVQLVNEQVTLYDPMYDRHTGPKEALERFGVAPAQMRDYLALVGDAIDNVAKVPGIGPKTAVELLQQFGDVETVLAQLELVKKPKVRESLRAHAASLLRAKQLVSVRSDLPIDTDIAQLERRPILGEEARSLFTELEFYKLLQEMPASPQPALALRTTRVVRRPEELALVREALLRSGGAFVPAYSGRAATGTLVGLAIALEEDVVYLPLAHQGENVPLPVFQELLGPALADPAIGKDGHDLKTLGNLLGTLNLELGGVRGDVELLSYLLNPSRREHALEDLARERLRLELPPAIQTAAGRREAAGLTERFSEEVAEAFGARAQAVRQLVRQLWEEVDTAKLGPLARSLELPLVSVLSRMERFGVRVDQGVLTDISRDVDAQCAAQESELQRLAGREFNVNSNAQLAQVLYGELKLPVLKRGKTGPSTDAEVLEKLAEQHPLPRVLLEYRTLSKLKSTYLDALGPLIAVDGRLHTTFHQAATATGRLSSSDPNLQNIPIRTEVGRSIRRAFVADPGWKLLSADYSQVELRILAHIAEDPALVEAFRADEDVHVRTAAEVFAIPAGDVSAEQRRVAKMVNFGIAYGLSPYGLATRLDIPQDEAAAIIERYFARYTGIRRYLEETVASARRTGVVETLFGRRRLMEDLHSSNRATAQAAERAAINMPIQGTAADLIKMAMLRIDTEIRQRGLRTRMLLQVHDELLLEAPEGELEEATVLVRTAMSGVASLRVPLRVDLGVGQSWAEAH
jgi:DNA polymerase-1